MTNQTPRRTRVDWFAAAVLVIAVLNTCGLPYSWLVYDLGSLIFVVYLVIPFFTYFWMSIRVRNRVPLKIAGGVMLALHGYVLYLVDTNVIEKYAQLFWPPELVILGFVAWGVAIAVRWAYRKIRKVSSGPSD